MTGLLRNLVLALGSLAVFLGVAESLARLGYRPAPIRYKGIFEYDREKVYALKRNVVGGWFVGKPVATNSLGHRDREIPIVKPGNGFRVLAIGDSVTFGHGVDAEKTWPERLEKLLAARFPSLQVEVVNTAVPGNSPFQEYVDLERALVLAPDAAVIQFVLNDVVEPYRVFRRYGGSGTDYHGVADVPYWDWQLSQRSAFYLLLKDLAGRVQFGAPTREGVRAAAVGKEAALAWDAGADEPRDAKLQEAWRECLGWMQREVELCATRGITVILLVTPVEFQFRQPSRTYAQRRLAEFAAEHGVAYLDLLEVLRARAASEGGAIWRRYFLDYDHLTPAGHDLVAEALLPLLERVAAKAPLPASASDRRPHE